MATPNASGPATGPVRARRSNIVVRVAARALRTTPGRYRALATLAAIGLVAFSVVALVAARDRVRAAAHLRDHAAPSLVAGQEVASSLAEADAAAISAFLSGATEDKDQRAVYERSLERVMTSLEQAARLIGDDPAAHDALVRTMSGVVDYAGLVESARAVRATSLANATTALTAASTYLADRVRPASDELSQRARQSVASDQSKAASGSLLVDTAGAVSVALLLVVAVHLARRTRRVINIGVALSLAGTAAVLAWSVMAGVRQQHDMNIALGQGRAGVELIGQLRAGAYQLEGTRTRALVAGRPDPTSDQLRSAISTQPITDDYVAAARTLANGGRSDLLGKVAWLGGGPIQQAEAAEMLIRWRTYDDATAPSSAATASQANAAFAGFNIAVDNVLASQENVLFGELDRATQRLGHLDPWVLMAGLLALVLLGIGVEQRAGEYR